MTRAIRSMTVCHSDDDCTNPNHRRVKIDLVRDGDRYRWVQAEDGADTEVSGKSVQEACELAFIAWGGKEWAAKATWIKR